MLCQMLQFQVTAVPPDVCHACVLYIPDLADCVDPVIIVDRVNVHVGKRNVTSILRTSGCGSGK